MAETNVKIVLPSDNSLLFQLPDAEWSRIQPHFQVVELGTGQVLYERHDRLEHAYFLSRGCVSLMIAFADGFQAEAGLVGSEGLVGVPLVYGIRTDIASAVVQAPSEALRISSGNLQRELEHMPELARRLIRYGEDVRAQAMQLAACNGHHGLDARLARCILTLQDRYRSQELPVTHEMLAGLLCAHRPSVSVAAKRLQQADLIRYSAGHMVVIDRVGLEGASCECYKAFRTHLDIVQGHLKAGGVKIGR